MVAKLLWQCVAIGSAIINWFKFLPLTTLSTEAIVSNSGILLYPNPMKDFLIIEGNRNSKIEIFNILGSKVFEGVLESNKQVISTQTLEKGVYLLNIYHNGFVKTSKIIKK